MNCPTKYYQLSPDRVSVSERMGIYLYSRGNPYKRGDTHMQMLSLRHKIEPIGS